MAVVNDDGVFEDQFGAAVARLPQHLQKVYITGDDGIAKETTAYSDKQMSDLREINTNSMAGDFQSRWGASELPSTMPLEASTELRGALKSQAATPVAPGDNASPEPSYGYPGFFNTVLGMGKDTVTLAPTPDNSKVIANTKAGPITEQDLETATNVGMSGGPGTMMGVTSKTINKAMLYKAQDMEFKAVHPDTIWQETGTFRGADGRWRQEIPETNANLKFDKMHQETTSPAIDPTVPKGWQQIDGEELRVGIPRPKTIDEFKPKTAQDFEDYFNQLQKGEAKKTLVKDILDHPELFKAYPDIGNIVLRNLDDFSHTGLDLKNVAGVRTPDGIYMANAAPDKFKSTLIHEIQHAIQAREGFAKGGNQGMFMAKEFEQVTKQFEEAKQWFNEKAKQLNVEPNLYRNAIKAEIEGTLKDLPEEVQKTAQVLLEDAKAKGVYNNLKNIIKSEKLLEDHKAEAFEKYMRLKGEVEARNVQHRMYMDAIDRKYNSPISTESRPRMVQIEHKD